jgi:hypothetical protein
MKVNVEKISFLSNSKTKNFTLNSFLIVMNFLKLFKY